MHRNDDSDDREERDDGHDGNSDNDDNDGEGEGEGEDDGHGEDEGDIDDGDEDGEDDDYILTALRSIMEVSAQQAVHSHSHGWQAQQQWRYSTPMKRRRDALATAADHLTGSYFCLGGWNGSVSPRSPISSRTIACVLEKSVINQTWLSPHPLNPSTLSIPISWRSGQSFGPDFVSLSFLWYA